MRLSLGWRLNLKPMLTLLSSALLRKTLSDGRVLASRFPQAQSRRRQGKPHPEGLEYWTMYVDCSYASAGCSVGVILLGPSGEKMEHAFELFFISTNNHAEYESLLVGLAQVVKRVFSTPLFSPCFSLLYLHHMGKMIGFRDLFEVKFLLSQILTMIGPISGSCNPPKPHLSPQQ